MNGIRLINWLERKFQKRIIAYAVIAAFSLLAYCNSFTVPFLLDDFGSISNNYAIQKLFDFAALWQFYANRIVLYFTLSINYFIHDNGVEGYHVTNLLIHIFNGILIFIILKNLLSLPYFRDKLLSKYINSISTIAAVLFVCHPMQINAVTYIVQRTASLAATFYFLAILFFIKFRVGDKLHHLLLTMLFTVIAMFTKENTITIPFMLLFIELLFFVKDGKTSWYKRILIFVLLFSTVPIIPGTNLLLKGHSQSDPGVSFKASTSMDRYQYFYTELNVILLYLKLMFIPDKQNFDYSNDYPLSPTIWDNYSYVSFIILALIAAFGLYTIKRNRLVFLGILWFFTGLAVESSFISIKDVYFEHRLYFPCAGFIMFLIGMAFYEKRSKLLPENNTEVISEPPRVIDQESPREIVQEPLQEMQIEPSPMFLSEQSPLHSSEPSLELPSEPSPAFLSELSPALPSQFSLELPSEPSPDQFTEAVPMTPLGQSELCHRRYLFKEPVLILLVVSFILAPIYTGLTIKRNYIYGDSIRLWSDAVARAPGSDRAHSVLATGYLNGYSDKKKNTEYLDIAEIEFKKAIALYYSNSTAHVNLSKVYLLQEEYQKCIDEAKRALTVSRSEYANYNIGQAYKKLGKIDEALDAFKAGYETNKKSSFILVSLADAYYDKADYANAKKYYDEYMQYHSRFATKAIKDKIKEIDKKLKSE